MTASKYTQYQLSHLLKSSSCISHLTQLQSLLTKSGLLYHPFYLRPLLSLSSLSSWGNLSYSLSLLLSSLPSNSNYESNNIAPSLPSLYSNSNDGSNNIPPSLPSLSSNSNDESNNISPSLSSNSEGSSNISPSLSLPSNSNSKESNNIPPSFSPLFFPSTESNNISPSLSLPSNLKGSDSISPSLSSLSFPLIRAFASSIHPSFSLSLFVLLHTHIPFSFTSSLFAFFPFLFKSCGRAFNFSDPPYRPFVHSGLHLHCLVVTLGHLKDHFVQNSLVSMYSLFGDINSARKVFDEMNVRTVVSWNALMNAYDRIGDVNSAQKLFLMMPDRNITTWNSFIKMCVKSGDLMGGQKVFDEMPQRDSISWNSLIAGYTRAKKYNHALHLFREMQHNKVEPTQLTLISVLGACAELNELSIGKEIHNYLNDKNILIDGYVGNALLDMYAKCGCLNLARKLFDEMSMKHVTCWNAMIVGFAIHGCSEEALNLFSQMEKESKQVPNKLTFLGVLIACRHKGLVKEGQMYFKKMYEKYNIPPNIKHYGCMVDLLSRCGLIEEAYKMVKEMPIKTDGVLWKTVLSACKLHKKVELAELAFKELEKESPLGEEVVVIMSNIYAEAERWNDVEKLRDKMVDFGNWKKAGWSQIESIG